ncbi:hybrid sensor histidine kinase/response regulator [Metapseudomonas otitidis]|uniref:histidine kinase n=1 Tax=Metapseudomonas otitidis TaxID=319939 RepID=A0A679GR72_9GAMM|nr:PAS domain-containing sensor histidine kinase [Pseudomonas otitidis]BCA28554.1 hybrid sensor histidine kinase/response regulator [Pseudomonas otitidis]
MDATPFPAAPGPMSQQVRQHDWSRTPLGPIEHWPEALRISVDTILSSHFPCCLVWGPQRISIYNDGFVPILGNKHAPLGRPFDDIWREAWDSIGPIAERAYQGQATFIEDFPVELDRHGRPEMSYFTFCYSPLRDADGRVLGMLDTVIETTSRVTAERQLRQLTHNLERQVAERTRDRNRLWNLSPDIMLVSRQDLVITAANPATQNILGWSEAELVGSNCLDLVHPDDLADAWAAIHSLIQGEPLRDYASRMRHRDGSYRWINWSSSSGDGFISAIGRDTTEERARADALRQAEEQLRQSQKMEAVGQLTGGLAHDFNNLLAGISGSLELLRLRIAQGRTEDLNRYIDIARSAAERAATLTHRLLAFSRRQALDPRPTDVNQLVATLHELISRTMGPNIEVECVDGPDLWTVLVDPNQLESALLNICINARDAMPNGGRLCIGSNNVVLGAQAAGERGLEPGDYLVLMVSDTGSGMSEDVISRAFEPFFTTKPVGQGTGLGLSMVYGFARQSGGQVRIASTLGQGTSLSLYLPRHHGEAEPAPTPRPVEIPRAEQCTTVLVVDDEAPLRQLMREVLEDLGYQMLEAADGPGALALLAGERAVDLLLADVGLPGGLNGLELARRARLQRPDLKVLFITGYAQNAPFGNEPLPPGMEVMAKPYAIDALANRIRLLLKAPPSGQPPAEAGLRAV